MEWFPWQPQMKLLVRNLYIVEFACSVAKQWRYIGWRWELFDSTQIFVFTVSHMTAGVSKRNAHDKIFKSFINLLFKKNPNVEKI